MQCNVTCSEPAAESLQGPESVQTVCCECRVHMAYMGSCIDVEDRGRDVIGRRMARSPRTVLGLKTQERSLPVFQDHSQCPHAQHGHSSSLLLHVRVHRPALRHTGSTKTPFQRMSSSRSGATVTEEASGVDS